MHTYIKRETTYDVGMWQPNREGITAFWTLFTVGHLPMALIAVNILNGGTGDAIITTLAQAILEEK